MKKNLLVGLVIVILVAMSAYFLLNTDKKTENANNKEDKINVMVSILPQVDFVERIGGDKVQVSEMIPPGFSPATYEPSPEQLQKLQNSDLYLRIGHIPFEKAQMDKLAEINPQMKIVDSSDGISLLTMAAHSHEGEDEHEHEHEADEHEAEEDEEHHENEEGNDPHVWLAPNLVKKQAEHIYDALVELKPSEKNYFTKNYNQFIKDLDQLDKDLKQTFTPIEGQTILVFHPAFGYLAEAYGFHQEAIEIEGKEPTPAQLQQIIDRANEDNVKIIFVQSQFSTKSAEAVAQEIGGAVVQIDPLAKDYFTNLENMAETIVTSLEQN